MARLNGQLADARSAASAAQAAQEIAEKQLQDAQSAASAERRSLHDQLGQERSANSLHLDQVNDKHVKDLLDITSVHDAEKAKLKTKIQAITADHEQQLRQLNEQQRDREGELVDQADSFFTGA